MEQLPKLSADYVLTKTQIKQNKNLLKLAMIQKILDKHGLPNNCPIRDVVVSTTQPDQGTITIKRIRPYQEGGNQKDTSTHIHVHSEKNKVNFEVTDDPSS